MPYKSKKQRAYMHAQKPGIARKWDKRHGAKVGGGMTKRQAGKRGGGKKKR